MVSLWEKLQHPAPTYCIYWSTSEHKPFFWTPSACILCLSASTADEDLRCASKCLQQGCQPLLDGIQKGGLHHRPSGCVLHNGSPVVPVRRGPFAKVPRQHQWTTGPPTAHGTGSPDWSRGSVGLPALFVSRAPLSLLKARLATLAFLSRNNVSD